MKEILDEPQFEARQKYFGYFASMAVIVLAVTIALIILGADGTRGSFLRLYIFPVILTVNCISTIVALVSSVLAISHQEPDMGKSIICLLFSLFVGIFWMIALFGYLASLIN